MGGTPEGFPPWPSGKIPKETASEQVSFGAPLVTFPALGKSRPRQGPPGGPGR
jgi:hypothetical protein